MPKKTLNTKPITVNESDAINTLKNLNEASAADLLLTEAYLNDKLNRYNKLMKAVQEHLHKFTKADIESAYGKDVVFVINGVEEVRVVEKTTEKLTYDKNVYSDETLTASLRETRSVLSPTLIKSALKAGTLDPSLRVVTTLIDVTETQYNHKVTKGGVK